MSYSNWFDIAQDILHHRYQSELDEYPGLETFLTNIDEDIMSVGGDLVSRQVVALAIETWMSFAKSAGAKF